MNEPERQPSAAVAAAVAQENRLTKIEAVLEKLVEVNTEMRDQVKAQNGRVGNLETGHRDLKENIRVRRELVEEPRWGEFESVASQVKGLWEDKAREEAVMALSEATDERKRRWWHGIKVRGETVLALLGIAGAVYTIASQMMGS